MLTLEGKIAIITGASSGIGLATATLFLELGASVFGVDVATSSSTLASHSKFRFQQLDLTRPEAPAEIVKACQDVFGPHIDILLNIAGVMDLNGSVDTLDAGVWDRVIAINLTAPVMLARAVVPVMLKGGGGSIVNVSSKAGTSGASAGVAYTASKHGIVGVTKNIAWRFHKEKVRCNAICPGGVATGIMNSVDVSKMDMAALEVMGPVHNTHIKHGVEAPASPDGAANIMAFLASDLSKEINGAIIPVDNAWSTI